MNKNFSSKIFQKQLQKADVGLIGLAVMGANLARNLAGKKIRTVVFNRTSEKTDRFIKQYGNSFLTSATNLQNFVESLRCPRKIILMVQAGTAVDDLIRQLTPLLEKDDMILDCGNSFYRDTERRFFELIKSGIHFVGCGVSGGEEGALHGPSLMPGGSKKSWKSIEPILAAIAAKDFQGQPCVAHIGEGAAGHYVKMVHNGIEYGVMQIMAETYDILRDLYQLSAPEIAAVFRKLQRGKLDSYLFEIAGKVLERRDSFHKGYLIDAILDRAGQKGTGSWTSQEALEEGVALPTVTEAVFARLISGEKDTRVTLDKIYRRREKIKPALKLSQCIALLEDALSTSMISTYAQGYALIQKKSEVEQWNIHLAEVSRIWQGGCIIRAKVLHFLQKAYQKNPEKHLLEIPAIAKALKVSAPSLKKLVVLAVTGGVPVSALASTLFYLESMGRANGPANFTQGLRDYFGAHGYERVDREGNFHTDWD